MWGWGWVRGLLILDEGEASGWAGEVERRVTHPGNGQGSVACILLERCICGAKDEENEMWRCLAEGPPPSLGQGREGFNCRREAQLG